MTDRLQQAVEKCREALEDQLPQGFRLDESDLTGEEAMCAVIPVIKELCNEIYRLEGKVDTLRERLRVDVKRRDDEIDRLNDKLKKETP